MYSFTGGSVTNGNWRSICAAASIPSAFSWSSSTAHADKPATNAAVIAVSRKLDRKSIGVRAPIVSIPERARAVPRTSSTIVDRPASFHVEVEHRVRLVAKPSALDHDSALAKVRVRLRKNRPFVEVQPRRVITGRSEYEARHAAPQRRAEAHR